MSFCRGSDQCPFHFVLAKQGLLGHFLVSRYFTPCGHPRLSDVISDVREFVATDHDAQGTLEASGVKGDQTYFYSPSPYFQNFSSKAGFPDPGWACR